MDDYVSKPVELDDIRAVLTRTGTARTDTTSAEHAPEAPASPPVIDRRRIDHLLKLQCERHPTLVRGIVDMFCNDSPQHLERLAQAIEIGDAGLLDDTAHRFLSSIENLGAMRMRATCMALESLGRAGTTQGAAPLLARLRDEFSAAQAELARQRSTL